MNKSTVLQDYNGNNIYPIIPYQNVFGLPSASGKQKIFFGDGVPNSIKSNYKDVEVNDIYINTNVQNRQGYFHVVTSIPGEVVAWTRTYGFYTIQNIDAPNSYSIYYSLDVPNHRPGIIWLNITNNKIFVCTGSDSSGPTWKELTDFYTKSEVDALFDELQFKINKKAKPVIETVTGSPITLEDSSNRDIKELTLYGKSEQVKTNGYQLLNQITKNKNGTVRGITYSVKNDGSIRLDGTADNQSGNGVFIYIATKDYMNSLESGNHILNIESDLNDLLIGSGNIAIYMNMNISTIKATGSRIITRANECSSSPYLWIKNGTTVHGNVSIMLEKGTMTHNCEIFTGGKPSPSTDYPQAITDITQEDITITDGTDTQTANLTKTLRGIPVSSGGNYTDNNNQQWICDTIERYKDGTGKYIQRVVDYTFDGTEDWQTETNKISLRLSPVSGSAIFKDGQILCSHLQRKSTNDAGDYCYNNIKVIYFNKNSKWETAEQLKTFLATENINCILAKATPIETPLTAEELAELDLSTYKPITNIISNTDVTVTYVADTKNYIDKRMTELQNAIISQGGNV